MICMDGFYKKEPQINADERRFVNEPQRFANEPQRTQRAQRFFKRIAPQKTQRTRMIRIGRIFTDVLNPCASVSSVQSVFYRNASAFICVHPRLIFENLSNEYNSIKGREAL